MKGSKGSCLPHTSSWPQEQTCVPVRASDPRTRGTRMWASREPAGAEACVCVRVQIPRGLRTGWAGPAFHPANGPH